MTNKISYKFYYIYNIHINMQEYTYLPNIVLGAVKRSTEKKGSCDYGG